MHNKKLKIFGIVVLFIVLGAVYLLWWQKGQKNQTVIWIDETESSGNEAESEIQSTSEVLTEQESDKVIFVYVCGYVKNPDVYELEEGARMFQAVELAGGPLADGDTSYLDMAGVLSDGERVYVPSYEEVQENPAQYSVGNASSSTDSVYGLININKATKEQLMTLPGIGEAKADAIIQYREQSGGFSTIEDIMNISGIKEAAFSKIKSLICT